MNLRIIGAGIIVLLLAIAGIKLYHAGQANVQAKWDTDKLKRGVAAAEYAAESARIGIDSANALSKARAAIKAASNSSRKDTEYALATAPNACPKTIGDALIPSALGLRLNAIRHAGEAAATE